jgi:hypothetical protein
MLVGYARGNDPIKSSVDEALQRLGLGQRHYSQHWGVPWQGDWKAS